MQRTTFFCAAMFLLSGCGTGDPKSAVALEKRLEAGDLSAIPELEAQANKNPWAALAFGRVNHLGIGKDMDLDDAMYYYSLAQKLPGAWYNAGLVYAQYLYDGLSPTSPDEPENACFSPSGKSATMKALDCLNHAAQSAHPVQARITLGQLYKQGQQDLAPNPALACQWFAKAAEEHDQEGRYQYALCLLTGIGAPQDRKTGLRLLIESAKSNNINAVRELARLFHVSDDHTKAAFWHMLLAELDPSERGVAKQRLGLLSKQEAMNVQVDLRTWVTAHQTKEKPPIPVYASSLPLSVEQLSN